MEDLKKKVGCVQNTYAINEPIFAEWAKKKNEERWQNTLHSNTF